MRIAIFGRKLEPSYFPFMTSLLEFLDSKEIAYSIFEPFYNTFSSEIPTLKDVDCFNTSDEIENIDYLFSVGGDGTFLNTLEILKDSSIPILGINTGRLGFLSSISTEETEYAITELLNQNYYLDQRTLLTLESDQNPFGVDNYALNEITLQKKDTSTMVTIHVFMDGVFLNSYWADGLIIATPTGSTAYSLSCNGPIVLPGSGNFIITPIAPHNLNVRPLVIPDTTELTLKIEGRTDQFLVALDSRSKTVHQSTTLTIKKADYGINLVRLKKHDILDTLRNKLMWGADKRN